MKDKRENHPNIITDVIEMPEANSTVKYTVRIFH